MTFCAASQVKILLTHRYVWPDTVPYAKMLRHMSRMFVADGHEVHLFGSMPSYRAKGDAARAEVEAGVRIARCRIFPERSGGMIVRVLNVMLYCTALFFHILRVRPDVVSASTFPPVVGAWSAGIAAKIVGARLIYHMQDIHPEMSQYSGGRLGRGMPARVLWWLDNQTLRRAAAIVVLSHDMADTLTARGLGPLPVHVINNFSLDDGEATSAPPQDLTKPPGTIRAIFAGNLGAYQNLPLLTEGIASVLVHRPEVELLFLGDGAADAALKARWEGTPQIRFAPFLPYATAKSVIAEADIGLVSLAPDIYRVAYPSKVMTYLDLGLPLLAMVEPDSALARTIVEDGLGEVPNPQTSDGVAQALLRLLEVPDRSAALTRWQTSDGSTSHRNATWRALIKSLVA